MTKKFIKGKILRKKIVHSEQPRKYSCMHRPSEVFYRNLSNAHQRAEWSKKTSVVKNALFPGFCAERMFIQNDILTSTLFI